MSKIRINELARELEVKPNVILDVLPELGYTDKKTHSSSLDDDVVLAIRRRIAGQPEPEHTSTSPSAIVEKTVFEKTPDAAHARLTPGSGETSAAREVQAAPTSAALENNPEAPAQPAPRPTLPLRPPLSSGQPLHPPLAVPGSAPLRPSPIAVRPVPAAQPGQILSGPRQALPSHVTGPQATRPTTSVAGTPAAATPGANIAPPAIAIPGGARPPVGSAAPSMPSSPVTSARQQPLRPAAPAMPGPVVLPGNPPRAGQSPLHPLRPPVRQTFAGQPAARPVVPPRADMVARLARPAGPGAPSPGAPAAAPSMPRPGVPAARPASPVPGRPIYTGPIRPGQPLMRGPGGP